MEDHPPHEPDVLQRQRPVKVELNLWARLDQPMLAQAAGRLARDHEEDEKRHERDQDRKHNGPDQPPDHEAQHRPLGSYLSRLSASRLTLARRNDPNP